MLDYSTQDVTPGSSEPLHRQIGQIRRCENASAFAPLLKCREETAGDSKAPVGCVNVNMVHKAAAKESMIHNAVPENDLILCHHEAFTLIDCGRERSAPGPRGGSITRICPMSSLRAGRKVNMARALCRSSILVENGLNRSRTRYGQPGSEELSSVCAQPPTSAGSAITDDLNPLSSSQKPIVTSKTPRGAK